MRHDHLARLRRCCLGALVLSHSAVALPAQARPADTAATRPVRLPAVHTTAKLLERERFEQKPNVAAVSLESPALRAVPRFLSEGDVLRVVQLLPGVQARNDYSTGLNVRGGEADQNLILLDGYPIYNPFHLGGLFGTFIDPAVGRIDMLTGGFPAAYGGRLSSVLDVRSMEESRRGVHGTAEASLISSSLSLGGAMGDGKGSWLVAARRTYADKAADMYQRNSLPYHFRDAQAHVVRDLFGGVRLAVTAYDGLDRLDVKTNGNEDYWLSWGNRVLGATLSKTMRDRPRLFGLSLGDSVAIEQRVSDSRFATRIDLNGAFKLHSIVQDRRVGGSVTAFMPRHALTAGYELASQYLAYWPSQPVPFIPVDSIGQRTHSTSLYVDDVWRPVPALLIQAGARLDMLDAPRWATPLPRLSVKYFLGENTAVSVAVGEYAQWVRSLAREDVPIRPLDFWVLSNAQTPVSRAWHVVAGVERWLSPNRMFRIEGFHKNYRQLLEPNPRDDASVDGDEFRTAAGSSYGVDLMLRQIEGRRFSGWLSYSYAVSARTSPDGVRFFPGQDRRHDLNLVGSWRLASYTFGARLNVASGTPYTAVRGDYRRREYDPATHSWRAGEQFDVNFLVGNRNGERLPLAHQLDLSISRRGRLFGAAFSPYLSVMNAYNARNVFAYAFDYGVSPPTRLGLPQAPILPTVGLSIAW